ncbi:IS1595 family transposase [Piscirickettsia salmonis]|uniref:IS1595 family transposase n=1 Tax=Piscirickettsia salmonis TaxID=1238 RepID=UPI0009B8C9D8|nr:IS1595 family transposase [Piscirickettsia salmonis]PEQ17034.1 IS1595 family transposase [Piscirickettsia salmonis]
MYIKHCKLPRNKQIELMKYFIAGSTARTAADLTDIHRNTATRFFHKLREKIALKQQSRSEQFCGKIELDESYFGGARKGKRGRGAAGKVAVFGLLKRGGKVYTQVILDAKSDTLMPIIRQKIQPDSIVYTDCWRAYNALDISEFKHYRINHNKRFAENQNHINGIENFWNQTKRHMRKFNGVPRQHFNFFLKEAEWRFNMGSPKELLADLKKLLKELY